MKSYHIFELYVVWIEDRAFICKYNPYKNIYREILTNTMIDGDSNIQVESLTAYYSPLELAADYIVTKPLKINKKQILEQCIFINTMQKSQELQEKNGTLEQCKEYKLTQL